MNNKKAGLIRGNPLCGLCYRECIEVTKIFDGCMSRMADREFAVDLENLQGTPPFTFVSAASNGATAMSNVVVNSGTSDEKRRVEYDAEVPVTVTYTDSFGVTYRAPSSVNFHREVFLSIPDASVIPSTITVTTSLVSFAGRFTALDEVIFRCCIMQISKVSAVVDLLVPSYGYCEYPSCDEAGPCEAFFNRPLFPPFA